jgi:hypothetical protein
MWRSIAAALREQGYWTHAIRPIPASRGSLANGGLSLPLRQRQAPASTGSRRLAALVRPLAKHKVAGSTRSMENSLR